MGPSPSTFEGSKGGGQSSRCWGLGGVPGRIASNRLGRGGAARGRRNPCGALLGSRVVLVFLLVLVTVRDLPPPRAAR